MTNEATLAQIDAALPDRSTWLSANAGSGKTRVLTDRVALLLLGGVQPQRILCLTYTKAAASEMQNRLFKRLGAWAMMDREALTASLLSLGVAPGQINSATLRKARILFAKAIETPGGLKIQTIHSFCGALLRRFPLEAQVSPAFVEMDDRASKQLRRDVLEQLSEAAPEAVTGLAAEFTGDDVDSLLAEISSKAPVFDTRVEDQQLRALFDLPANATKEGLLDQLFDGTEAQMFADSLPILRQGTTTDQKLANSLAALDFTTASLGLMETLEGVLLAGGQAKAPYQPKSRSPTKDTLAALSPAFDTFRHRLAELRPLRLALHGYARTNALHDFAPPFIAAMKATKQARGWLDFDDMIRKARDLLSDHAVAAWVLFKLDGGIDHILVDEAQDTSPAQWDVIRLLSEEFFTGDSARADQRTVFVVGDKKQSIYSFQGADPAEFDRMRAFFADKHAQIDAPFRSRELLYSFRSAPPILQLVDTAFTEDFRRGMGDALQHKAFKQDLPGRVDLWNWIEADDKPPEKDWHDPVDTVGKDHPAVQLAEKIARHIEDRVAHGQITQVGPKGAHTRRIRPGDFLILVQSRGGGGDLFSEIIRACKARGLPMAGADRLRVGGELGVRDLIALLRFLETPQDDLALAEVIRSPLGNLTEQTLFQLAHSREGSLWSRLDARQADFPALHAMLDDLRAQADYMRPYDLLERALTRHGGRERLLARLGQEAEEGIAALLNQSLQYELTEAPSLTGFLSWLVTDDVTIKRQVDSEGDLIRIMTVHGAKGLEAPIVILPQTGDRRVEVRNDILLPEDVPIWKARAANSTERQNTETDRLKELNIQENMRLLYVALTRAESQLIVCGAGKQQKTGKSWYEIIENGLTRAGALTAPDVALRLTTPDWPEDMDVSPETIAIQTGTLPDWVTTPPPPPLQPVAPLSPSDLGGAKVLPGQADFHTDEIAKQRGTQLHLLLEHLADAAREDRLECAARVLGQENASLDLVAEAEGILDAPHLGFLFAPTTLAEVGITATLPELGGTAISGSIDRLVIDQEKVLAVDFKSNRLVPESPKHVPEGLLRQMGAYAAALSQVYPGRRIETAIIWTRTAEYMTLPHDIVREALARAHTS